MNRIHSKSVIILIFALSILLFIASTFDGNDFGLEFLGFIKTKTSQEIQNSPWGIQVGSLGKDILDKASAIGVKWTRLQANWSDIEREKGKYYWEETDKAFESAIKLGITPFVTISGTNKNYIKEKRKLDPKIEEIYGTRFLPPTSSPEAFKAWLNYVRKILERYKDKIKYWEIWNEPNHFAYWGDDPNGKEYGKLVNETAKVIKEVDPDAKIIAGATAGLDPEFTDEFLSVDNANLVDKITFHNYGSIPEERIYKALEVWKIINRYNPKIELWQGECGYPSHSSTRDYRGTSPWGLTIQAKWLLRQSFTDTYFCNATLSNYFKLYHEGGRGKIPKRSFLSEIDSILGYPERNGSRVKVVGVNEKCLLANPTLEPKPGYFAYRNLCALIDNQYQPIKLKKDIIIHDSGVFYGIGKEDDAFPSVPLLASYRNKKGNFLLVYWLPWHPQEIIKCARIDLKVHAVELKKPVLIDLIDGKVYEVNQFSKKNEVLSFANIPLADYPLIIMEQEDVQILSQKELSE